MGLIYNVNVSLPCTIVIRDGSPIAQHLSMSLYRAPMVE